MVTPGAIPGPFFLEPHGFFCLRLIDGASDQHQQQKTPFQAGKTSETDE